MDSSLLAFILGNLHRLGGARKKTQPSDRLLLEGFALRREEAAFVALVQRHGGMVWGVCRRILGNAADADDAFQATFLVLLHKAATLRGRESLAGFLQGVAWRLARKLRAERLHRQCKESRAVSKGTTDPVMEAERRDLRALLDEELDRLPEKYRLPLILCHLEGLTYSEAARHLGWQHGTVCGRLARGRELLRQRLCRRGLSFSAAALTAALPCAVDAPAACVAVVVRMTTLFALGSSATEALPSSVSTLAQGILSTMSVAKVKVVALVLALFAFTGVGLATHWALAAREAPPPQQEGAGADRTHRAPARASKPAHPDPQGIGLPVDAIARLGTLRFRHGSSVFGIAFSPDGKHLVSADWFGARLWETATGREVRRLGPRFETSLRSVSLSADGKTVALAEHHQGLIQLIDVASGNVLRQFRNGPDNDDRFCSAFLAPNGKILASVAGRTVRLWSVADGKELRAWQAEAERVHDLLFSPDGKTLITGGEDGPIRFWDTATGKEVRRIADHPGRVMQMAMTADGKLLASVGGTRRDFKGDTSSSTLWIADNKVYLWDVATGKRLRQLVATGSEKKEAAESWFNRQGIVQMRFAPDGKTLVTSGQDGTLRVWDVGSGKELRRWKADCAGSLAISPDGKILASGGSDASVRLWDPATGRELGGQAGHRGGVQSLVLSGDGQRIATASRDRTVRIWDTATGQELHRLVGPEGEMRPLVFSADGRTLTTLGMEMTYEGADRKGRVWDVSRGKELHQLADLPASSVTAISPNGRIYALVSREGQVHLWDAAARRKRGVQIRIKMPVAKLAFSPDNRFLFACCGDGKVHAWDVAEGKERRQVALEGGGEVLAAAFSSDGRWVAWAGREGGLRVHDLATGKEALHITGAPSFISALAFAPDGRTLAVGGGYDATIGLWEVATGQLRHSLRGHQGRIFTLVFSADGKRLASGSEDTTALLWDLTGGHSGRKPLATEVSSLWKDLASADAETAYQAIQALAATPKPTLAFLGEQLQPVPRPDAQRVAQLLAGLDQAGFMERDRATRELRKLGSAVEPALRAALADAPSPEARRRLRGLLEKLESDRRTPSPSLRQVLRAIEVVERIGNIQARRLLERLAEGAPAATPTCEAAAAVRHLQQQPASP